jgi:hypothetical protein
VFVALFLALFVGGAWMAKWYFRSPDDARP